MDDRIDLSPETILFLVPLRIYFLKVIEIFTDDSEKFAKDSGFGAYRTMAVYEGRGPLRSHIRYIVDTARMSII